MSGRPQARQDTARNSSEGSKLWAGATELGIVVTRDFLAVLHSVEFAQSQDRATPFSGTMLHFTSEHIDVYASNGTCLATNRVLPQTVASIESAVTVPATFVSEIAEHFSGAEELRFAMNAHGAEYVLLVSANGPETLVQPLWSNDSHLGVIEAVRVEEGSALVAVATLPLGSRVRKIPPTGSVTLALAPGKLIMRAGSGMIDNPIDATLQGNPQQVLMDAAHLRSGYEFVRQSHSDRYTHVQFQMCQSYGNMYGVSLSNDGETVFGRSDFFFAIGPAGTLIHSAPGSTAEKPGDAWLNAPAQPEDVDAILRELDDIIGQPELKEQVRTLLSQVRMSKIKEAKGLKGGQSAIHMVFTGPPGTGKTTVARIIARLYFALGVLKNDTVTEVERSDLVSSNVGGTEENTAKAIEDAMGGVLFIDEAYQLVGEGNDFGKRAIDAILKALEDRRGEFVCIAAGYTDEMRDFIDSNPGMKSRFTKTINFSTYSSQELVAIAEVMAKHSDNIIAPESAETLKARLSAGERQGLFQTKDWGNARSMRNLLEAAAAFRDVRLSQDPALDFDDEVALMTITQDDMVRACDAAQIGGHTAGSETPEDVLAELDQQIGQPGIKRQVAGMLASVRAAQERAKAGIGEHNTLIEHLVFTGPPGTGKTTIARLIARLYRALGLLGSDRVVEVDQSDLVAGYVGQTALQTTRKIDEAMGGVLFVDEAYSLVGQGGKSFGGEAIDTLLKRMEDDRGRFMVIAAGYPDQMERFVRSNPGLPSRFTKTIEFQPYSPEELTQIAELMAKSSGALLDDSAVEALRGRLERAHRDGEFETKEWGNARTARNLVDEASRVRDLRLFADFDAVHTAEVMVTITQEDIEAACATQRVGQGQFGQESPEDVLAELEKQIGQPALKQQVASLLASVRAAQAREAAGLGEAGTLLEHLVFTGPPGTGKTTIARLIARLYRSLGLLKSGRVIEVDRGDLVAGYVGQTAPKTTAKIEEAMGGVLFIDEAYSLAGGGPNDLGPEAIDTLLKRMEDDRGEFLVIAAGYPEQMQDFLRSNPGLPSRFTKTIAFQPYSVGELVAIAGVMAAAKGEHLTPQAEALLNTRLVVAQMGGAFDKADWGNARTIRNIVDEAGRHRSVRLFGEPGLEPSPEELTTLTAADVAVACAASRLGTADPGTFAEPEPAHEPELELELELEPEPEAKPSDLRNDTHDAGDALAREGS